MNKLKNKKIEDLKNFIRLTWIACEAGQLTPERSDEWMKEIVTKLNSLER